jgi:hypothetical protein
MVSVAGAMRQIPTSIVAGAPWPAASQRLDERARVLLLAARLMW